MAIGSVDQSVTGLMRRAEDRRKRESSYKTKVESKKLCVQLQSVPEEFEVEEGQEETEDTDFKLSRHSRALRSNSGTGKQSTVFKVTSKVADRFGLSLCMYLTILGPKPMCFIFHLT